METQVTYLPQMSFEAFKRSRNRILAGATDEYERVKQVYQLTTPQDTELSAAHDFAIKTND